MKTIWKVILIAIAVGLVLAILGLFMGASQSVVLNQKGVHIADEIESRITESNLSAFKNINVKAGFSDVELIKSDHYGVDAYSSESEWDWSLDNGTLSVTRKSHQTVWVMNFNFSTSSTSRNYLKIYFPDSAVFDSIDINADSGDVNLGNLRADSVKISNSFGKVAVNSVVCDTLQVGTDSGDFSGSDITARNLIYGNTFGKSVFKSIKADRFTATCSSSSITLSGCEFGNSVITSSFGEIRADSFTSSGLDMNLNSGDIDLSGEFSGDTVIRSSFGTVSLVTSLKKDDYTYDLSNTFGDITIDGDTRSGSNSSVKGGTAAANSLRITVSSGDVEVRFGK